MKAAITLVLGTVLLTGCSGEPRGTAYFEAHPEEAIRVTARCTNGDHHGFECDHAQAALAAADRRARMDRYQQNF